jgi:two-component system, cell cycle response regulator
MSDTAHLASGSPPSQMQPAAIRAAVAVLRLLVKGFSPVEHRLLEGTVKLSQRRAPRIDLVSNDEAASADVVLIDATNAEAVQWAANQPWLTGRAAIWAGAKAARPEHMVIERQVKWPILPVLLYRALELASAGRRVDAGTGSAGSRRVLVVDDSLAVRKYLRSMLERNGAEVVEAENAEAAIEAAINARFACVLLDVLMPGIDGFEACRRLKARAQGGAALPVVMLTSKSSPFDRIRGKMAGCDSYLTKPVDPAQLHEVVAAHLEPIGN